jgi:ABC-type transporter MlaC component
MLLKMILKPVFIIALVTVVMIGVMVPSVFAETSVQETYDQEIQKPNKEALDKIEAEQAKPITASPLECEIGIPDEY